MPVKTRIAKSIKTRTKLHVKARAKKVNKAHANNAIKARASKATKPRAKAALKAPQKSVLKNVKKAAVKIPKKAVAKQSVHTVFRSHAIRAHAAIKKLGESMAQQHRDIHYRFVQAVKKSFSNKQHSEKSHGAHQNSDKKSIVPKKGVLLLNMTKNHLISDKVVFANTAIEKFRGLMFRNRKDVNYALVFDFKKALKNSAAIHMFFVFFPIDVVYLRDSKVIDLHREVKPFTAYLAPKTRADTLIELPQGTIWRSGISIGDEILTTSG